MADEKASPNEMLYIGDSPEDEQAAMSLGIHFIGRESDRRLNGLADPLFLEFEAISAYVEKKYVLH